VSPWRLSTVQPTLHRQSSRLLPNTELDHVPNAHFHHAQQSFLSNHNTNNSNNNNNNNNNKQLTESIKADLHSTADKSESVNEVSSNISPPILHSQPIPQLFDGGGPLDVRCTFEQGILRFNHAAKEGLNFLMRYGMVSHEPDEIAEFLLHTDGLNKVEIGHLLGEADAYSIAIMNSYIHHLNFTGLSFPAAVRHFLSGQRLPGEAQKIDRLMERFAERYSKDNPHIFVHVDHAYLLAFALIMLNTDLHSQHIKHKMKKSVFLRSFSEHIKNGSLTTEFLINCYDDVAFVMSVEEREEADCCCVSRACVASACLLLSL